MNECYVDTSAFIAFRDQSDAHHSLFKRLFSDPPPLITSPLVIAEGQAWFLRRQGVARAIEFLGFIEELKGVKIQSVGQAEIRETSKLIRKFPDQDLTIADAVGLLLMQRLKIKSCWSTDFHLGLTGVPLIIHQG